MPTQMAEDSALSVTYHHNLFLNVNSGPRVRWGTAHVFNNHFQNVTAFGVVSESDATVLVDHNMFDDDVSTPDHDDLSGSDLRHDDGDERQVPRRTSPLDIIRADDLPVARPVCVHARFRRDRVSAIVSSCAGTGKIKLP